MATSADCGALERLTAELRNRVYAYVLARKRTIRLDNYGNGTQVHRRDGEEHKRQAYNEVVIRGHRRNPKHCGQTYNSVTKTWHDTPRDHALALLRANNRVSTEATAILYSSNKFELRSWSTLERFLNQIGSSSQRLRNIRLSVGGGMKKFSAARTATGALAGSTNLRSIEVSHFDFCSNHANKVEKKLDTLVDICKPLLQSLQTSYEENGLSADLVDVIKIILDRRPRCISSTAAIWSHCRGRGTSMVSFSSSQWRYVEQGFQVDGKVIHCACLHHVAPARNITINEMLRRKVAEQLGLNVE